MILVNNGQTAQEMPGLVREVEEGDSVMVSAEPMNNGAGTIVKFVRTSDNQPLGEAHLEDVPQSFLRPAVELQVKQCEDGEVLAAWAKIGGFEPSAASVMETLNEMFHVLFNAIT